ARSSPSMARRSLAARTPEGTPFGRPRPTAGGSAPAGILPFGLARSGCRSGVSRPRMAPRTGGEPRRSTSAEGGDHATGEVGGVLERGEMTDTGQDLRPGALDPFGEHVDDTGTERRVRLGPARHDGGAGHPVE